MSAVVQIPTATNAAALWEQYASLMREMADDPTLAISLEHSQRVARAWAAWRDAFLSGERR